MKLDRLDFSIIIAVYQRAEELSELLLSLEKQTDKSFEVIVIDDGSPIPLKDITEDFKASLNIRYFHKKNSGPGLSRNFGMTKANGNYFIFLDSDTLIPENYIEIVRKKLNENFTDAYGGPDAADNNFSVLQKSISFSMTSVLTTGGIRGGSERVGKFQPRSFNMGISKKAFEKTGGFGNLRIGEDPDLSMTLWENDFETQLIKEAFVYHKRRTSMSKFAKQVYQFGIARPILNQRHPGSRKLAYWFPTLFSIGKIVSFLLFVCYFYSNQNWLIIPILFYILYFNAIFFSSLIKTNSILTARITPWIVGIQFFSYGFGFLKSWIYLNIFRLKPEKAFSKHFTI